MESREKTIKLLETFLSEREVEGVCGYLVDYPSDGIEVIVIIDGKYMRNSTNPTTMVARMIKAGVKWEIQKWLNIDCYVGATVRDCDESINESVVYDYQEGRNESPERLPFDVNKLLKAGAVYITPAIEGDPNSKHYKKFLKRPHTHLITLYNLKHASPDSWIHTAITRFASPKLWEGKDFVNKIYDGKYNQILWSLDELGIPYESMLLDDVNESKKEYIITESQLNLILENQKNIQVFQDLIDSRMNYINRVCANGAEDYEGDVGDESCKQIAEVEKIEVTSAEWVSIKHSNREKEEKYMSVRVLIYYSSIRRGTFDADDLTYDLEQMIRKSTGMPFILNYDTKNTNTFFEW